MTRQERGERIILSVMSLLWVAVLVVLVQQQKALGRLHQRNEQLQLKNEALNKELTDHRLNELIGVR